MEYFGPDKELPEYPEDELKPTVKKKQSVWQSYNVPSDEKDSPQSQLVTKTVGPRTKNRIAIDVLFWSFAAVCLFLAVYWVVTAPPDVPTPQPDSADQQSTQQKQASYDTLRTALGEQQPSQQQQVLINSFLQGKAAPVTPAGTQSSTWQSPDGLFQILFPILPKSVQMNLGTVSAPMQVSVYSATVSVAQYFASSFDISQYLTTSQYNTLSPDQILEHEANVTAADMGGTLQSPVLGTWQRHAKINYVINSPSFYVEAEDILVGTRLYFIGIRSTAPLGFSQTDVDKFENSFQLTP